MKKTLAALGVAATIAGCTQAQINNGVAAIVKAESSPAGALFCSIYTAGGGNILANIISASATIVAPSVAPAIVLATNAAAADLQMTCSAAAAAVGGTSGAPVPPPIDLNTQITQVALAGLSPAIPTTATAK